jgi:molybdopterin synthase catalytic subunit
MAPHDTETFTLRYFAATRDALGRADEVVALSALGERADVDALWSWLHATYPATRSWRGHVKVAVAMEFADGPTPITAGAEVALLPPASGGAPAPPEAVEDRGGWLRVTQAALNPGALDALVRRPDAGAVVCFTGRVRDHTGDHDVSYLEYDAYPDMALAKLAQAVDEAAARWPQTQTAVHHRWGRLEIGEAAVVVATSSPHRAEAFAACQYVIDRLKEIVPIWKKEVGPGGEEWVGFGP